MAWGCKLIHVVSLRGSSKITRKVEFASGQTKSFWKMRQSCDETQQSDKAEVSVNDILCWLKVERIYVIWADYGGKNYCHRIWFSV